jgi:hypothetical protein
VRLSAPMPPPMPTDGWPPVKTDTTPTPAAPTPTARPSRSTRSGLTKSLGWLGLGLVGTLVFLIMALGLFAILWGGGRDGDEETAVAADPPTLPAEIAAEETTPALASETPSDEPPPATAVAAEEPSPTATPTLDEPPPQTPPPAPGEPVTPTPVFPDGTAVDLVYDENSFYLYNTSAERIRVNLISFVAVDEAGRPLRYGMEGNRWTQFYAFVDAYACNRIEPFGAAPYLRPSYCRAYSATVTPAQDGVEIFWRERDGAVAFRVLWSGQEIGRCPLAPGSCTVYVP